MLKLFLCLALFSALVISSPPPPRPKVSDIFKQLCAITRSGCFEETEIQAVNTLDVTAVDVYKNYLIMVDDFNDPMLKYGKIMANLVHTSTVAEKKSAFKTLIESPKVRGLILLSRLLMYNTFLYEGAKLKVRPGETVNENLSLKISGLQQRFNTLKAAPALNTTIIPALENSDIDPVISSDLYKELGDFKQDISGFTGSSYDKIMILYNEAKRLNLQIMGILVDCVEEASPIKNDLIEARDAFVQANSAMINDFPLFLSPLRFPHKAFFKSWPLSTMVSLVTGQVPFITQDDYSKNSKSLSKAENSMLTMLLNHVKDMNNKDHNVHKMMSLLQLNPRNAKILINAYLRRIEPYFIQSLLKFPAIRDHFKTEFEFRYVALGRVDSLPKIFINPLLKDKLVGLVSEFVENYKESGYSIRLKMKIALLVIDTLMDMDIDGPLYDYLNVLRSGLYKVSADPPISSCIKVAIIIVVSLSYSIILALLFFESSIKKRLIIS